MIPYLRLPTFKSVSLMGLVHNTGSFNSSILIEKLVLLTEAREEMRVLLKQQDKLADYSSAMSILSSIKKYVSELHSLEKLVAENPCLEFTLNIVFIWKSALVETAFGAISGLYTKKILNATKNDKLLDIKSSAHSKLSFKSAITGKLKNKGSSKLYTQSNIPEYSTNAHPATENQEPPYFNYGSDQSNPSGIVSNFNQKQSQDPNIEFEKANTLFTLGLSKIYYSYILFDGFEICFDSELTNQMLPVETNTRTSLIGDSKNLTMLKKMFPFKKIKSRDGKEHSEQLFDDWAQRISQAVKELRESAGLFQYILTELANTQNIDLTNSDLNPTVLLMLQKISLADADRLVASNAIKLNYKPSIISRMLLYVSEQYNSALNLSESLKLDSLLAINSNFLKLLKRKKQFVYGLALIFLAKDSFKINELGLSVAYIKEAKSIFTLLVSSRYNFLIISNIEGILEQTEQLYAMYNRTNDTHGFERIPSLSELKSKIPSGRPFNDIATYNPIEQTQLYF
ncbi:hypothetical protein BB561_001898 [Smittium simulii]|uniref:pH-response regulator protein palC n=1 Tax=Smittium simulii TaxID=133385 RepID=A0A2T9YSM1_9FUNG|nr:hypothetical protein BB561_001898 [Smittium simulii]